MTTAWAGSPQTHEGGSMILGHYEYDPGQSAIGGGAMGNVHTATDIATGEQVALKILHPHLAEDDEAIHRLQREARLASRIRHPNIARTLEQGQTGEIYWIAMELVPGRSLRRWMKDERRLDAQSQGRGTEAEACAVGLAVSAALAAAHAENVVHRDVKPGNILLPHGFEFQPDAIKLGDFGAARAGDSTFVTRNYSFVGTPEYAAPEAFEGKPVAASDQYSLGATLYELLAGRAPFNGEFDELRHQHRTKQPDFRPIRKAAPTLAPVIERLLAKNARDRYPSAEALRAAIADIENPVDELALSVDFPPQHEGIAAVTASTISTVWHLPAQWRLASASFAIAALVAGTSAWVAMNANAGGGGGDGGQAVSGAATERPHGTVRAATAIPPIGNIPAETPGWGDETPNGEDANGSDNGGGTGDGSGSGGGSGTERQENGGGSRGTSPATNTPASGSGVGAPSPPASTPVPTSTTPSGGGATTPPTVVVATNTPPPTATTAPPVRTATVIITGAHWETYEDPVEPSSPSSGNGVMAQSIGNAQVVCLRTSCAGLNYGCSNPATCTGTDRFGCQQDPLSWANTGAPWIWAPGISASSPTAGDASYYFAYSFDYEGDFTAQLYFALDDGMKLWIDGDYVDVGAWGQECQLQTAPLTDAFKSGTTHTIKIWGVNGFCDSACTYAQNPAGVSLRIVITPR